MKQERYSRRALLKHMGVSAALLPLISTERAEGAVGVTASGSPKRFVAVTHANGVVASSFYPTGTDLSAPLPPTLSSLESVKAKMIVAQGIDYTNVFDTGQSYDGHFTYCSTLTGTRVPVSGDEGTNSARKATGPSIDQLISDNLVKAGVNLKASLLTLGVKSVGDGCSTSWRAGGQQNAPELDPSRLFMKLFSGTTMPPAQMMNAQLREQSILDFVKGEFSSFGKRLGTEDKKKIEEHLQAVRELEIRVKNSGTVTVGANCAPPTLATGSDTQTTAKNMFDIMAMALKCDVTRTITMTMYDDGGGDGNSFPFLGISSDYHNIAHDLSATARANKVKIDTWIYSNVANLAKQLEATKEGDKTALDNTVIATFSDMEDGETHYNGKIPITLIGSCGGYFKTNKSIKFPSRTPINKLLASICNAMDLPVTGIGDAKYAGTLPQLTT